MIFASTALAARIERAECQLLSDAAKSAARRRPEARVHFESIAGGAAAFTAPGSPLNKLAGLGFDGPVDERDLEALEQIFAQRKVPLQVEVSCLADPEIVRTLTQRNYVMQGFENVLGMELSGESVASAPAGFVIDVSPLEELDLWVDVVVNGFAAPDSQGVASHESFPRDELERTIRDLIEIDGFVRYLVRCADGWQPVGGGSLRMCDGVAQFCGATTLPDYRRRGIQTSLLAWRLAEASRNGCDLAVVTTQPGSKSHENVQRRGFDLLYTRAILVRDFG